MKYKDLQKKRGFVILYAVMISSMLLAISLGVSNILLKEIKFGTSVKNTNDAFFAADIGAECALYYDKSTQDKFPLAGPATSITCANVTIMPNFSAGNYDFIIIGLGDALKGCAKVNINKSIAPTQLVSKGYNNGSGGSSPNWTCTSDTNTVERQLELNY